MERVRVIDSHTEGEPTRVIISGAPDFGGGAVSQQAKVFRDHHDDFRRATINEPRGNDFLVGAVIVPPADPRAVCGVIFYNNVGLLNACGHGTIGLAATLMHLGRIGVGLHPVETPVGLVTIRIDETLSISIDNVPSYRYRKDVPISFKFEGQPRSVTGDIAWGGNWFCLIKDHGLELSVLNIERLNSFSRHVRAALEESSITGDGGGLIDHIELFGSPTRSDCDSRNFVYCPGGAYDRSPCGTGTSAKMACLYADGMLNPGQCWRQESIIASRFVGTFRADGQRILPTISGNAYVTAETDLLFSSEDPFRFGIPPS